MKAARHSPIPVVCTFLCVLLLCCSVATRPASGGEGEPQTLTVRVSKSIERGLDFIQKQGPPRLTSGSKAPVAEGQHAALAAYANAVHGDKQKSRKAVRGLLKHWKLLQSDLHSTALALLSAAEVGLTKDSRVARLRRALVDGQSTTGFWGYSLATDDRGPGNLETTHWAVWALCAGETLGKKEVACLKRALAALRESQSKAGSWGYDVGVLPGESSESYLQGVFLGLGCMDQIMSAFKRAEVTLEKGDLKAHSRAVNAASVQVAGVVRWLRSASKTSPFEFTLHSLLSLSMTCRSAGVADLLKVDWYGPLATWLVARQAANGTWPAFDEKEELGSTSGPMIRTCLALLALRGAPVTRGRKPAVTGEGR